MFHNPSIWPHLHGSGEQGGVTGSNVTVVFCSLNGFSAPVLLAVVVHKQVFSSV